MNCIKANLEDLYKEYWLRMRNEDMILWETKDHTFISIKNMTNNHLINSIKMLEHKIDQNDLMFECDIVDINDCF